MAVLNLGVLILAAGGSSRLGSPKQLLLWQGETLIEKAIREVVGLSSSMIQVSRIAVVLGANYETIYSNLMELSPAVAQTGEGDGSSSFFVGADTPLEIITVRNDVWQTGIASSISCGIATLGAVDAALIWLCDQPLITSKHLRGLVECYIHSHKGIAASRYLDSAGVPAVFGQSYFAELQSLSGDRGAKSLFHLHPDDVAMFNCPEAGFDIDTADDYHRAIAQIL